MEIKRKGKLLVGSAVTLSVLGLIFAVIELNNSDLQIVVRILAMGCVAAAVLLAVFALYSSARALNMNNFNDSVCIKNPLPQPPSIPAGLDLYSACTGSIRGALRAIGKFEPGFATPLYKWELERCSSALAKVLSDCEAGADPQLAINFATQYLPSAMQYLAACVAEGCPQNCGLTLSAIACACEKQADAMTDSSKTDFKAEYDQIRGFLEMADFRWSR